MAEESPFTGEAFTGLLLNKGIAIGMDGKGAGRNNVFVERLWRTVKCEEIDGRAHDGVAEARVSICRYLDCHNAGWPHSLHGGQTPDQVWFATCRRRRRHDGAGAQSYRL